MTKPQETLLALALEVLQSPTPAAKVEAAQKALEALEQDAFIGNLALTPPLRPARPERPALCPPSEVPRRRLGSIQGRAALLHAVAHIEFNAINLAFDMAVRFAREADRLALELREFVGDWIQVGGDEARHFGLIAARLEELGFRYGDFPAHDGLWEAAENTADNFLARLAVAPLILEARGLDVTPGMIRRLEGAGDEASASILKIIYTDEIGHVACGERWFSTACGALQQDPAPTFQALKAEYFAGSLKPPFNHEARDLAGLPRSYYDPF